MKKQLLLVLGLMFTTSIFAAPVTKDAAKKNIMAFLQNKKAGMVFATSGLNKTELQSVDYPVSGNAFYVFNFVNKPGFVIASADDRVEPILGYSYEGNFDPENVPVNMQEWLNLYASQINHVVKSDLNIPVKRVSSNSKTPYRHNIPVMLKSKWNQQTPYNDLCPIFPEDVERRPTGCVATAMAQVLYYHKWPKGEIPAIPAYNYYDDPKLGGNGGNKSMPGIPAITFDWANMTDEYGYNSTQQSKRAVAELMLYCGYAVHMGYHPGASGALSFDIPKGLRDYLGYDKGARYLDHEGYSEKEWENIVYNEIENNRPVLYSGSTDAGGHQFVCDGYENEYFHFNWGWGGRSDGFFKLNVLDPNQMGVVGGNNMNFSSNQQIIVGVQPPVEGSVQPENSLRIGALCLVGKIGGLYSLNNRGGLTLNLKAYFGLNLEQDMYLDYGYALYDKDNNLLELSYTKNDFFETGWPQSYKIRNAEINIGKINKDVLKHDGIYYLRPMIKNAKGQFQIMDGGEKLFLELEVIGSKVKVVPHPIPNVRFKDISLDTPVYSGTNTKIHATLENLGDDFTGFLYLMQDGKVESGACDMVSLNKGEVKEVSLLFATFVHGMHTYGLSLNGSSNSDAVEVEVHQSETTDASLEFNPDLNVSSEGNFLDIPVEITNKSTLNNYDAFIISTLYMKNSNSYKTISTVKLPLKIGTGAKVNANVHFENLELNKIYYVAFSYIVNGYLEPYGGQDKYENPNKVFKYKTPDAINYFDVEGNMAYKIVNEGETFQIPSSACYVNVPKTVTGRKFLINSNTNCLYNVRKGVSISDFINSNIIRSATCDTLSITDAYDFYSIEPIKVSNVELAINVDKEMTTIALPFIPATVKCEGQELRNASSLAELATADYAIIPIVAEESDKIYCDFDQLYQITAPSILVVKKKYIGKQFVFSANDVVVDLTSNVVKGEYFNINTANKRGVVEGSYGFGISAFSTSLNTLTPFRLYLTSVGNTDVKDVKVVYPEGMTTGIADVDAGVLGKMVNVYSIDGIKVKTVKYGRNMLEGLPSGLYIVNGKKFVK